MFFSIQLFNKNNCENNFHVKERLCCLFPLKYIRYGGLAVESSNSKIRKDGNGCVQSWVNWQEKKEEMRRMNQNWLSYLNCFFKWGIPHPVPKRMLTKTPPLPNPTIAMDTCVALVTSKSCTLSGIFWLKEIIFLRLIRLTMARLAFHFSVSQSQPKIWVKRQGPG